jgi:hypothetical protein
VSADVLKTDWAALALECRGNVELMAARTHLSRRTLERHFQLQFGIAPSCWAKKVLMESSLKLLAQGFGLSVFFWLRIRGRGHRRDRTSGRCSGLGPRCGRDG